MDKQIEFNNEQLETMATTSLQEITKAFREQIYDRNFNLSNLLLDIQIKTDSLINNIDKYLISIKALKQLAPEVQKTYLDDIKKNIIYKDFFELQNSLNLYYKQKIIMTYVHIDEEGTRHIVLFDNDVKHLSAQIMENQWTGTKNVRLVYQMDEHGKILKNSLPDEKNQGLQMTAKEITTRYQTYKHKVLWKINNEWYGYRFTNLGPINEAFTSFYVRNFQFKNELQQNIHVYMLHTKYGAIAADNANGFILGDTHIGGLQFAVKGIGAGPQGITQVKKELLLLRKNNFTKEAFEIFRQHLQIEEEKKATSLIKPLTKKSLQSMVRLHGGKLLEPIYNFSNK